MTVVVDGKPTEWLGLKLEVTCHGVKRHVLLDFASLGDEGNVELQQGQQGSRRRKEADIPSAARC